MSVWLTLKPSSETDTGVYFLHFSIKATSYLQLLVKIFPPLCLTQIPEVWVYVQHLPNRNINKTKKVKQMWLTCNSCRQQRKKKHQRTNTKTTRKSQNKEKQERVKLLQSAWLVIIHVCQCMRITFSTGCGVFVEMVRLCDATSHDCSCSKDQSIIASVQKDSEYIRVIHLLDLILEHIFTLDCLSIKEF